jgi:hypothetical protein
MLALKKYTIINIYLFVCLYLLGCETEAAIINRQCLAKNALRLKYNVQAIPKEFVCVYETSSTGKSLYIVCHSPKNISLNSYLGKEIILDNNNEILYETDTYEYKDSVLVVSSYLNDTLNKSSAFIFKNNTQSRTITYEYAKQLVGYWKRQTK